MLRLMYMLPSQSAHNTVNSIDACAVCARECGFACALLVLAPNITHLLLRQLSAIVLLATGNTIGIALKYLAPLRCHIKGIRRVIAQKQMIGADTCGIVAMMADKGLRWNRAVCQHPSNTGGFLHASLIVNTTVSMSVLCCCPPPTSVAFANTRPKTFLNRRGMAQVRARWGMRTVRGFAAGATCSRITHVGTPIQYRPCHGCCRSAWLHYTPHYNTSVRRYQALHSIRRP